MSREKSVKSNEKRKSRRIKRKVNRGEVGDSSCMLYNFFRKGLYILKKCSNDDLKGWSKDSSFAFPGVQLSTYRNIHCSPSPSLVLVEMLRARREMGESPQNKKNTRHSVIADGGSQKLNIC